MQDPDEGDRDPGRGRSGATRGDRAPAAAGGPRRAGPPRQKSNVGGADTNLHYHLAAFLHTDGRMYVACRAEVVSVMAGPDGPMQTTMKTEFVAILSKP